MVAPVHARLRLGGKLYSDASWSVGMNFSSPSGGDPFGNLSTTDAQSALEDWVDAVKALNGTIILPPIWRKMLGPDGDLREIRASRIGPDGKESAVALLSIAPPIAGQGNSITPAQTAIVVSLQTGRPGASYRGRLYVPATGCPIVGGRVTAGDTAGLASGTATFLRQIAQAAGGFNGVGGVDPCVVSNTRSQLTPVTGCRVGNRLDTQRRRAEAEKEVYSVAAVPQ